VSIGYVLENGVCNGQDDNTQQKAIFRLLGDNKYWARSVSREYGNYDYLMFADIDHAHPQVYSLYGLLE